MASSRNQDEPTAEGGEEKDYPLVECNHTSLSPNTENNPANAKGIVKISEMVTNIMREWKQRREKILLLR